MWSWARFFLEVGKFFNAVIAFVERQKLIAQGRAEQREKDRAHEEDRVSNAAAARDRVVTDGMQPADVPVKNSVDIDPYNRDNWK